MKRLYASIVYRGDPSSPEAGDNLYVVDWDTHTVLARLLVTGSGGKVSVHSGIRTHGARGVAIAKDLLYVAGSSNIISVYRLGQTTPDYLTSFEIPGGCIHQIRFHDERLYVASAADDHLYVLRDDVVIEAIYLPDIVETSLLEPRLQPPFTTHPYGADRLHFNSLAWDAEGAMHHIYLGANAVYDVTRRRLLPFGDALWGPHDLVFWNDWTVVNSSMDKSTIALTKNQRLRVIRKGYGNGTIEIGSGGDWGFARGMVEHQERLFCGSAPFHVHEFKQGTSGQTEHVISHEFINDTSAALYDFVFDPRD